SARLITGRSGVRVPEGPPDYNKKCDNSRVLGISFLFCRNLALYSQPLFSYSNTSFEKSSANFSARIELIKEYIEPMFESQ
ncbi:MAG: hypothetical protein AB2421_20680, partial [Thermotaleaceae bacterium]